MTLTYPYEVTVLADLMKISEVVWGDKRNDEISGSGDARVWQAELADPLWTADVTVDTGNQNEIKKIAALIRSLKGAQEAFYLYDPTSKYPQSDPTGSIIGSSTVQVHTASGNAIRLKGLPAAYALKAGDKFQVTYATTKNYFGEVSEDVMADGSGITASFSIYPPLPAGLLADDAANLKKPACKMFIMPGTFNPGKSEKVITSGLTFKAMERKR
jgi:hypothetical protein